ncbi:MAG: NAD(P)-dependent oxidoreductase [Geminicoccaceae bacterium]
MAEIVITEFMDQQAVDRLSERFNTLYDPGLVEAPDRAPVESCRALIVRNRTQVRGQLLERAARLEAVGRLGVGLDNIDLEACAARNIEVLPATGANAVAVAEYVIAALLVLWRGAYGERTAMIEGAWPRQQLIGREAAGKLLGLFGLGDIARKVAKRARALGITVQAFDPYLPKGDPAWELAAYVDLDTLLATSDAISLHIPLTDETRGLFDAERLAAMKDGALLINTARGGIVDEAALAASIARTDGGLGGAALDVFESEPLSAEAGRRFEGLFNVILTPHIAGVTDESNERISALTADNVERVLTRRSSA